MKGARLLHLWLGMFLAPSILLFAGTGALQIFGLHEDDPPAVIAKLAEIHMKQSIDDPPRRPPRPAPPPGASEPSGPRPPPRRLHQSAPLQYFFLLVCLGLITTTGLGIYMAIRYQRDRRVVFGLLAAGAVVPALLLLL
jgi:hypothetical protein